MENAVPVGQRTWKFLLVVTYFALVLNNTPKLVSVDS